MQTAIAARVLALLEISIHASISFGRELTVGRELNNLWAFGYWSGTSLNQFYIRSFDFPATERNARVQHINLMGAARCCRNELDIKMLPSKSNFPFNIPWLIKKNMCIYWLESATSVVRLAWNYKETVAALVNARLS